MSTAVPAKLIRQYIGVEGHVDYSVINGFRSKAATDPKNWIRDPAGSDPDPDPLVHGTYSIGQKIPQP